MLLGSVVSLLNLVLLFYYSSTLAVIAVVIAAVGLIVNAAAGFFMLRTVRPLQEQEGKLRGLLIQLINAVSKIRIAGAETRAFAQWGRAYSQKQRLAQELQIQSDRVRVFGLVLSPLSTAILFWFAFADVFGGGASPLTLAAFMAFSAAFGTSLASATALGDSTALLLRVAAIWQRVAPILENEPELTQQKNSPGILAGRVRLDHVAFRYRENSPLTLDDVTIHVDPGECIAIVGPSGSGSRPSSTRCCG